MDGRLPSARRLDTALHWLNVHEFGHRTASWDELLRLRSLPEMGLVTERVYDDRAVDTLRVAALLARRSARFQRAGTYAEAKPNLCSVVDMMTDAIRTDSIWRDER